jgi:hypothetical protein
MGLSMNAAEMFMATGLRLPAWGSPPQPGCWGCRSGGVIRLVIERGEHAGIKLSLAVCAPSNGMVGLRAWPLSLRARRMETGSAMHPTSRTSRRLSQGVRSKSSRL